jgi:pyruvate dehydrogenase E2 component (dihydrolipoamide acetyltransferase)
MPTEVILPRVDMDMSEGTIAAWYVNEGDEIRAGAVMFEIETSKATMEVDAPASGIVRQITAPVGTLVPVGVAVAWIYEVDEALVDHVIASELADASAVSSAVTSAAEATPVSAAPSAPLVARAHDADQAEGRAGEVTGESPTTTVAGPSQSAESPLESGTIRATPAARRLVREHGLRLVDVTASGPNGRVEARDVLRCITGNIPSIASVSDDPARELNRIWLRKGTGCPLVLLHGFAAEANNWRPLFNALRRTGGPDFGVLAIDLPAHGKSGADAAGSLEQMVAAVEHTLAAEGIRNCHLAGHSFGGAIALGLTTVVPGLHVRSLSLISPAGLGPESNGAFIRGITASTRRVSLVAWLKQLFANPAIMDEGFIATAEQQLADPATRARLAAVAERFFPDGTQALDLRGVLAETRMPVRVIWGLADRILPASHAEGLPGRIAVHRFANVGHLPHVEAQDAVAEIIANNMASALHTAPNLIECTIEKAVP